MNNDFNFFSALPLGCVSLIGPYTMDCLTNIWIEEGCLEEGLGYPKRLGSYAIGNINLMNLT